MGLEDYLKTRGGGKIIEEKWTVNLDSCVSNFTDKQKRILKNKIEKKKNETHSQHNDVFHEISIACAFYDKVNFLPETDEKTPDFCSNGICVEVKTINNSDVERKRQDELNKGPYCNIGPALNRNEIENIKKEYIDCVSKKFTEHINNAKGQLNPKGGHIWVVYAIDWPPELPKEIWEEIKKEIENKFDEIIKKTQSENFCIRYINFELLREKIAS